MMWIHNIYIYIYKYTYTYTNILTGNVYSIETHTHTHIHSWVGTLVPYPSSRLQPGTLSIFSKALILSAWIHGPMSMEDPNENQSFSGNIMYNMEVLRC